MDRFNDYDYRSDEDLVREISLILNELRERGYSITFSITIEDGKIDIVEEDKDDPR